MRFVRSSSSLIEVFYDSGLVYKSPSNFSYFWNFGFYATICLVFQLLTGIFLAMHYISDFNISFLSVEHIMRDVNYGWLLRYLHANGASMFFIVVYVHMGRNIYYTSYAFPRQHLWIIGVIILFLMILTAFIGYVLPWGQMSFWGATVITNLVSAVPGVGSDILIWLWGGYSVSGSTLTRFFSLHYTLPFILTGLVIVHFIFLHEFGSNNPLGVYFKNIDSIPFYPYYVIKDLFGIILFLMFYFIFAFFLPNFLGHPDNYIPANPLVTPPHIVPEWYFLPFYAILRSIPDKLLGVVALLLAILSLIFLPYFNKNQLRSLSYRPFSRFLVFLCFFNIFLLGVLGMLPIEYPFVIVSQLSTFFYFFYFLILSPVIHIFENSFWSQCVQNNFFLYKLVNFSLSKKDYKNSFSLVVYKPKLSSLYSILNRMSLFFLMFYLFVFISNYIFFFSFNFYFLGSLFFKILFFSCFVYIFLYNIFKNYFLLVKNFHTEVLIFICFIFFVLFFTNSLFYLFLGLKSNLVSLIIILHFDSFYLFILVFIIFLFKFFFLSILFLRFIIFFNYFADILLSDYFMQSVDFDKNNQNSQKISILTMIFVFYFYIILYIFLTFFNYFFFGFNFFYIDLL